MSAKKNKSADTGTRALLFEKLSKQIAPLLASLSDASYLKDADGRYTAVNAAFIKMAGLTKSKILGAKDADIFPAVLAEKCRASDERIFKQRKPLRIEERIRTPKGKQFAYDTLKVPILETKHGVLGLLGISRDISKYRRTREDLKSAEERLGRVVANAPVILFAVDENGKFILLEGQGLKKIKLKPGQAVGRSVFDLYSHNKTILASIEKALKGKTFTKEIQEAGRIFEMHFAPHRSGGKVRGVIGVAIDITERAQAEKQKEENLRVEQELRLEAQRVNRTKDEFLALLSHELRTPMTAMIGWTWLLRTKGLAASDFNMALDTIERNMKTQAQIIEDLLDISHMKSGKMRIESGPVDLPNVLRSGIDVIAPAAEARNITIAVKGSIPPLVVSGDPERLQQAVWNLLSNAVKFTQDGGHVEVQLRRYDDSAEISIKDDGVGIDKKYLPHVFDLFSQAEDPLTREHRGLGLGLAIIKHIAEMHGGAVRVHSEGEGKGSEFMISIPLLSAQHGKAAERPARGVERTPQVGARSYPDLSKVHILIVEDEPDTRMVLSAALKHCGARVTGAATAAEGFDLLRRDPPDVLISDIAMPGEDGLSLIRRIRDLPAEEGGKVPAAALTGRAEPEDRSQALMAGFQMYLLKPVEPVELAAAVLGLAKK